MESNGYQPAILVDAVNNRAEVQSADGDLVVIDFRNEDPYSQLINALDLGEDVLAEKYELRDGNWCILLEDYPGGPVLLVDGAINRTEYIRLRSDDNLHLMALLKLSPNLPDLIEAIIDGNYYADDVERARIMTIVQPNDEG